jgi:uncharacterized membrane protein YhhN
LKIRDFTKIYAVLLIIHLAAIAKGGDSVLVNFTKPLLVFSLLAYYNQAISEKTMVDKLFLAGLAFSWLGDILLMYVPRDANFFIFGLAAFLVAHVLYIFSFSTGLNHHEIKRKLWLIIIPVGIAIGAISLFLPYLGDLKLPVLLYIGIISAMLLAIVNRGFAFGKTSYWFLLIGAVLFISSDFILAFNKFVEAVPNAGVLIMLTYGLAQYALVRGMLERKEG